jgi:hypothetical protein
VWERGLDPWGPLSRICWDLISVELTKFNERIYVGFRIVGCDCARGELFKKEMQKGGCRKFPPPRMPARLKPIFT